MNITQNVIYKSLKRNPWIYFTRYRLCDSEYRKAKKQMKNASKSRKQIKEEMDLVRQYWGCPPLHYVRYGLFDKTLTKEELLDYIPPFYFYNYYCEELYSKEVDYTFVDNKFETYKKFTCLDIPTPDVIVLYRQGKFYDSNNNTLNITNIPPKWGGVNNADKLFFKPICGQGGKGIVVLKKKNNNWYYDNEIVNESHLIRILGNGEYIIQKGICQCDDFMRINPSSVNTLRVIVQWRGGEPHISVIVMRIGRNGKDVDNSSQGGMSVRVDVATGQLYANATAEHGGGKFTSHPDTGFKFGTYRIAHWEEIKSSILAATRKLPELPEFAWDVAVTEEGIEMIELNTFYALDHLQCCCGGMRRVLGVYPN